MGQQVASAVRLRLVTLGINNDVVQRASSTAQLGDYSIKSSEADTMASDADGVTCLRCPQCHDTSPDQALVLNLEQ